MTLPLKPDEEADLLKLKLNGDAELEWIIDRLLDLHYKALAPKEEHGECRE